MSTSIKENGLHITLDPQFLSSGKAEDIFTELKELEYSPLTFSFGERKITPLRRVCAYSDDGALDYSFSGITVKSLPWIPALKELKTYIEVEYKQKFNFCLLNFYPNGEASISPHKDDENCHVEGSAIVTVSFGASRILHFTRSGFKSTPLELTHGSSLVMYPPTNQHWHHEIKKTSHSDLRISATFRHMKISPTVDVYEEDDDPLIDAEYGNLIKNPFFNAQSEQLDYEINKIKQLQQQRSKAKRNIDQIFEDEDDAELNKKLCAINELDLNFDIQKIDLSDSLFLCCTQFNGELKVHLRMYYKDNAGVYKPSRHGFAWSLETWYEIYNNFDNFSLKYPYTSFIADNCVAFMSFNNGLVIKSLYRTENTLSLNASQYENFTNCFANFTKTIIQYNIGDYLRKMFEKHVPIVEYPFHNDVELLQILITCIESNLNINCLKRFKCDGCISGSLSQYKHLCESMSKREIFQTFNDTIYLTLNIKEILKQFKSQVDNMSKTFICLLNYSYIEPKIFDMF